MCERERAFKISETKPKEVSDPQTRKRVKERGERRERERERERGREGGGERGRAN